MDAVSEVGAVDEQDEALLRALVDLASTAVPATWRALIERRPDLLSDRADEMLALLAGNEDDAATAMVWQQHRDLLRRCREVGPGPAIDELTPVGQIASQLPSRLRPVLVGAVEACNRYAGSRRPEDLDAALDLWSELVADPALAEAPTDIRQLVRVQAGKSYTYRFSAHGRPTDRSRAIDLLDDAARLQPPTNQLHVEAIYHLGVLAYESARLHGRHEQLPEAIALCKEAIGDNIGDPELDAGARFTLARALQLQHTLDHDPAGLRQADALLSMVARTSDSPAGQQFAKCHEEILYALFDEHDDHTALDRAIALATTATAGMTGPEARPCVVDLEGRS